MQRNNQEDLNPQNKCCDNLKYCAILILIFNLPSVKF